MPVPGHPHRSPGDEGVRLCSAPVAKLRAPDGGGSAAPRRRWGRGPAERGGRGAPGRALPLPAAAAAARPALPAPPGRRGVAGGVPAARARSRRTPPHKSRGRAALRFLGLVRRGAAPTAP